jgi:AcrR family transcriptional regulator
MERMIVKEWMVNSLLQLMRTTPYDDITITQITKKAGVSRMTYYRNYFSKDEILASYTEYLTEKFASLTRSIEELNTKNYLKALFDFCLDYINYLSTLMKYKKFYIIMEATNNNIDKITKNNDNIYYYKYYAGAIFNVLMSWLQNGANESSEEMAEKLEGLISSKTLRHIIGLYNYSFIELD